jgi:dienelactone hydrolase
MKIISFLSIFLLSIAISCAQEPESKKTGLVEKEVEYISDGTVMKGFLVYDGNIEGKRPGVLVVHEWWGNVEYSRIRARMLAELGYTAFALDMYGNGKQVTTPDEAGKLSSEISGNIQLAQSRFMAAYNLLKEQPTTDPGKIAAIGYCFGGGIVLQMARLGTDLKAVVSFHGFPQTNIPAEPNKVKAFVLFCNGAADPFIKKEDIDAFKKEMDSAGVKYEFKNYPDAVHAFTNPAATENGKKFNIPIAYNEKADKESWEEMKTVLKKVFN